LEYWKKQAFDMATTTDLSWREIARQIDVPRSTVSDFLRKKIVGNKEAKLGPKVLVLDIETKYMLLEGWALFNQNFSVDQIGEDWSILSYSAKWYDSEDVLYSDVTEISEDALLGELHVLLDKADFIIAHNGRRFDLKKIKARMITRGFKPFSPVRVIDTLEIAKQEFAFTSNKLLYLTRLLCKRNQKSAHGKFAGHLLWKEFLAGNPEAVREMREYNIIDVVSLQELYDIMAPWSSKHPNFEIYSDSANLDDWEEDGYHYTNLGKYVRYRNKKTGQYRRGRVNILSRESRAQLLANIV